MRKVTGLTKNISTADQREKGQRHDKMKVRERCHLAMAAKDGYKLYLNCCEKRKR
jgi:hypothetical protein